MYLSCLLPAPLEDLCQVALRFLLAALLLLPNDLLDRLLHVGHSRVTQRGAAQIRRIPHVDAERLSIAERDGPDTSASRA